MSYLHITDDDLESRDLLVEFAKNRIGKEVAVSFKTEALNEPGTYVSCEPVNLIISNVLGRDIYFMAPSAYISSIDDEKY